MRVHFIAIGGSVMHNLAIALHLKGEKVSGSDDEIFEPSRGRLEKYGLLPDKEGWNPDCIHTDIDLIILGMHAREDNPELIRARELGITIYSFPEFLYNHSINKKRVVIGGSHGKTTITAMIMHVLKRQGLDFDYLVGAQLDGFDVMVRLSDEAPVMIFEGDEYLTSALDRRPKFHLYKPHIALLSGIAWDHMNVFPTFENYVEQFTTFINLIVPGGTLIFCEDDDLLSSVCQNPGHDVNSVPYNLPDYLVENGTTKIMMGGKQIPISVFGRHNLLNIEGAKKVCMELGVTEDDFYKEISSYRGAAKRLEELGKSKATLVFKDFAHAPSKLSATTHAVKEQYPNRKLVACMELHTYSSLNKEFLSQYEGSMDSADLALVFYDPHALKLKRLPRLNPDDVAHAFQHKNLEVYTDPELLKERILGIEPEETNFLFMSSGNFGGIDLKKIASRILDAT